MYYGRFNELLGKDLFLSVDLKNDYVRKLIGVLVF